MLMQSTNTLAVSIAVRQAIERSTIIALIVFGPGKLPGVGKALGESIHGFKKGIAGDDEEEKPKEIE